MADNIAVTPGAGATVSTEEVTSLNGGAVAAQHLQRVILAVRTADGTAVDLGKAEDAAHASADVGVPVWGVANEANTQFAADGDYVPVGTDREGSPRVTGNRAHDAADSGGPVKVGAKAETQLSGITLVADGDRTDLYSSEDGVLYTRSIPAHPADYIDATPTTITSSTSDTSVVSAGGANVRVYITAAVIHNKHATTTTRVSLKDGSGGTVKAILPAPATAGCVVYFNPPLRGTANTAWHAACADSVDSIYVTLTGYKSKV